ncbi:MAG: metal-binding protein [Alteromonadaceae bacterium]|nr:metal-binding protein [Alteromonadaceae bacterium]MBH86937.1 metal-binding protein [Alteromonadaceae bacterium]|tara:strand:- start:22110 stop:22550 length:441 start_codon:yes stop_codon:yes gene_type:complete
MNLLARSVSTLLLAAASTFAAAGEAITVYKSPSCGCCTEWVSHLKDNGFDVTVNETDNINAIKMEAGLTRELASCHTAFAGDYVIEGHVPASDIHKLLAEAPKAKGLAVPGMPMGSPGMEMGDRQDAYTVVLFNEQGQTQPFAQYP